MIVNRGFKVAVCLNNKQTTLFNKSAGCARFACNWGLNRCIDEYNNNKRFITAIELHKEIVQMKKTEEFKWLKEVSKCAPQEALRDLERAFKNFFRSIKSKDGKFRYPKYHSKHSTKQSFRVTGSIKVVGRHIKFPTFGKVKVYEKSYVTEDMDILSATMSRENGHYFITLQCRVIIPEIDHGLNKGQVPGLDLGIKSLIACSNGTIIENPLYLKSLERRLKRIQRRVSRKFDMNKQGNKFIKTKNIVKWQKKLSKVWYRIKCLRNDYIHKATTSLVKTKPEMIVMEDLQVLNMVRNHKLSKSILDSLFGEIYRQLKYKCEWNGIKFYVVDKFYPSSKTCSRCGSIKTYLKLSDRIYRCDKCGLEIDRDFNASLNLRSVGLKQLATV